MRPDILFTKLWSITATLGYTVAHMPPVGITFNANRLPSGRIVSRWALFSCFRFIVGFGIRFHKALDEELASSSLLHNSTYGIYK